MIRVIVLDDHPLIRHGMRSLLSDAQDIEIVGEGGSGEELRKLVETQHPDVILLDLNMPEQAHQKRGADNTFRPFEAVTWIQNVSPPTRVLIVSQHFDLTTVERAARAGVQGYLLKDDRLTDHLADAVRSVYHGGAYFSVAVSEMLHRPLSKAPLPSLTNQQLEVLQAICASPNQSYSGHVANLGIEENTLRNHLRAIFERLDVNNLAAAIIRASQLGLIDPTNPGMKW
ncbi:Transcriptional regulatory protein DegU [Thermoflexales bacterium]|nr:Transcriptional regulatory protein DegU [Thermoflexales bacterium]